MLDYTPTSRRPIANLFRKTANFAVTLSLRWNIHPDIISYLSVVAAGVAGVCFWKAKETPFLLLIGPLFCYFRLWLNMLDGMVALASHKASLHGEVVNEVPDRVSDILIFIGVAHSNLCLLPLGYWAAILAVFTAYIGIFGQAIGVQREFSGFMSKPWRMVTIHFGSWALWIQIWCGKSTTLGSNWTPLDWALVVIIFGCLQTIVIRLKRIIKSLYEKA